MACKRDRIIELVRYIESCGVFVNVGKNRAFGNKGFFKVRGKQYRIDISKNLEEKSVLNTLVHEFVHFIHYNYDKTLKSLDFIFDNYFESSEEDLINLTVDSIPKDFVKPLFEAKKECEKNINYYYNILKFDYPDIKKNEPCKLIEKYIKGDLKYLLKYDRVKVLKNFTFKIYSIDNIEKDFSGIDVNISNYLKLKSSLRKLKRINSKISRMNKYYNSPTELLARSFEYFISNPQRMKEKTNKLYLYYEKIIRDNKIPMLTTMFNIINK